MAIERVNSVFDIPEIKKEWTAFIAGLNDSQKAVVELFTTIQGYKGATLATIGKETDKLAAATAKVVTVTDKMNAAVTKAERAKLAALKTDQQVLRVMQEEEKVLQQTSKTKQASIRLEETMTRQKQRMAKEMEKEVAAAQKTATAYEVLKGRYNQASMESKELAAQMWATAKGDKALYDQLVKDNKAYQDVTAAAQKYYGQLDALETSVGQYQRRVGQYERSNYALGNSFQQLTREAPAFANSVQTGLMGISNNLPIFADAIQEARAKGQSFGQIMKSLGSSLFSFTGIVGILTTVLTFLPQILSAMSNSSSDLKKELDNVGESSGEVKSELAKLVDSSNKLQEEFEELGYDTMKILDKSISEVKDELQGLNKELGYTTVTAAQKAEAAMVDLKNKMNALNVASKAGLMNVTPGMNMDYQMMRAYGQAAEAEEIQGKLVEVQKVLNEYYAKQGEKAMIEYNDRMLELEEKLTNDRVRLLKDQGDRIAQNEALSLEDRLGGMRTSYEAELMMINVQEKRVLESLKSSAEDKRAAVSQANADRLIAERQYQEAATELRKEYAERDNQAVFEMEKNRLQYSKELAQDIAEDEEKELIDRRMALYDFYQYSLDLLKKERDRQLQQEGLTAKERQSIELEFQLNSLRATQEYYDKLIEVTKFSAEKLKKEEERILSGREKAIRDALSRGPKLELTFKTPNKDSLKDTFDKYLSDAQKIKDTIGNVGNMFGDLFAIGIDTQKVKIEELEAAQQKAYENEVKRISNSQLSEQEKADKLKILEAERQAQKEANERKTRKLETERARFQKAQDIANIISSTAVAVISALGAKPWTPLNIALAASVGALGAAQLAKAVAVPLPKYAEGTESSKGGWALTDELGPELYIEPGGNTYFGNDKPTLRQLRPGTKIIPSDEIHQHLFNTMMAETARQMQMMHAVAGKQERNDINELKDAIMLSTEMTIREMRRQKKQTNIKNVIDLGWGEYVRKQTFN